MSNYRCAIIAIAFLLSATEVASSAPADVQACFTPGADCEGRIADAIDGAKASIRVQAYGFTSTKILGALRRAIRRGVDVEVILDRTNAQKRYAGAEYMTLAGAPVWIDDAVAIAHNKVIVIDGQLVIGGSFNFTRSAQDRNAENVTFIDGKVVADWYLANWEARLKVSHAYGGR